LLSILGISGLVSHQWPTRCTLRLSRIRPAAVYLYGMPQRLFYPFRFRDPVRGKWVRARYVAELHVIAARYAEWEITGPAEVRETGLDLGFSPHKDAGDCTD
jgi:hypothetical protein